MLQQRPFLTIARQRWLKEMYKNQIHQLSQCLSCGLYCCVIFFRVFVSFGIKLCRGVTSAQLLVLTTRAHGNFGRSMLTSVPFIWLFKKKEKKKTAVEGPTLENNFTLSWSNYLLCILNTFLMV